MKIYNLPDLGEGLAEAEIIEWFIKEGDQIVENQPLVSVETDKAIVEIPAPFSGQAKRLCAKAGDVVDTGAALLEYHDGSLDETREGDTATVVGKLEKGEQTLEERAIAVGRRSGAAVKAMPAVRALAKKLDVDLALVSPGGPKGSITMQDVRRVAKRLQQLGPQELLRGPRRTMAIKMAQSGAEVVPASIFDDADIQSWPVDTDITVRLIMAIVTGCRSEPSLNAWFDPHAVGRRVLEKINVAIAVDNERGLFTPVLKDVASDDYPTLLSRLMTIKEGIALRKLAADQMRDYSISLSNFGMFAGRYATPVVVPPSVAIIGAGHAQARSIVKQGESVVHRTLPLSLSFDHRAVTGGEAARFLAAMISSLEKE